MSNGIGSQVIVNNFPTTNTTESISSEVLDNLVDVNLLFSYNRNNILLVSGLDAINNMILNLAFTRPEERDFEPEFGTKILNIIHEPNDSIIASQVEIELFDKVEYWIPVAKFVVGAVICQPLPQYQSYRIIIGYKERATGIENTFSFLLSDSGRKI